MGDTLMALILSGDSGFDLPDGAELAVDEGGTGASNDSDARINLGLGNVDNVSATDLRDRSTHTGTQALSTISDAGTIASQDSDSVSISGGTIDGVAIGGNTASSGAFTTLEASGDVEFSSTGALTLPVGTTAERPATPVDGMIRYNTDRDVVEYYDADEDEWVSTGDRGVQATGGTVTEITENGIPYRVHTFTSVGTSSFQVTRGGEVEYLIVAGGGSGGVDNGGGGGAGGLITGQLTVGIKSHTITVGDGGPARSGGADDGPGSDGDNSSALDITALGGSGGTGWINAALPSGNSNYSGGSGAGQACSTDTGNPNGVGTGTAGQGNDGGAANPPYAGGGGGAGGTGQTGNSSTGGVGGIGSTLSITGNNDYYAGGGTGGFDVFRGASVSSAGSNNETPKVGNSQTGEQACPPNTGHGGHGANHNNQTSGAGGSGIVVIRYKI